MLQKTARSQQKRVSLPTVVLLVENDPTNAELFVQILYQETPYHVLCATNGHAALHFTRHVKPQLFLLDIYLPDMNGIQLYDRIHVRKDLEDVPAVIMGACLEAVGDDITQRGLLAMEKPFDLDDFLCIIDSILSPSSVSRD